jgi:5-carboxymethyl-2-hydroxymuconate isomerase
MPHLTIEYTSNLDEWAGDSDLLLSLHHLLQSVAGIDIRNCKSRWRMMEEWLVGEGSTSSAFVHLDIRFLEGRPADLRQAVGAGALEVLRKHFATASEKLDLQVTVEVLDIRRAFYFKDPPGTLGPPPLTVV